MDLHLKDKAVVVTGGSAGIGKAVALGFAREGAKVAICARNPEKLQKAREEFAAEGYELFTRSTNVTSREDIDAFAAEVEAAFGRIDIWINNVGVYENSSILEETQENWGNTIDTNLSSYLYGTQAAAKRMKETGGGAIVNTSSVASILPSAYRGSYAATKYAVNGLTTVSAGELAPFGIRVNAVAPGATNTAMAQGARDYGELLKHNAIRRLAEPEEVANAYLFLASDVAAYITGAILNVSGGKFIIQDCDTAYNEKR